MVHTEKKRLTLVYTATLKNGNFTTICEKMAVSEKHLHSKQVALGTFQKHHIQPVYMIKAKVTFLMGRLLPSQSEQFKKYSKSSDWLEKSRPSKKATFVLIM